MPPRKRLPAPVALLLRRPELAYLPIALFLVVALLLGACTAFRDLPNPSAEATTPEQQIVALRSEYLAAQSVLARLVHDPATPEIVVLSVQRLDLRVRFALDAAEAVVFAEDATDEQRVEALEAAREAVRAARRTAGYAEEQDA